MTTKHLDTTLDLLEDIEQAATFLQLTYGPDALAHATEQRDQAQAVGDAQKHRHWQVVTVLLQETEPPGQDSTSEQG